MGPMVQVWAKVPWRERGREEGSEELDKSPIMEGRGGEGRGERKGGLGQVPWMEGGRQGGRKEGEGRASKKSVDIWEF